MLDSRANHSSSKVDRVLAEVMARQERGERIDVRDLLGEHSDIAESLRSYFENAKLFHEMLPSQDRRGPEAGVNIADGGTQTNVEHSGSGATSIGGSTHDFHDESDPSQDMPIGKIRLGEMLGRYRIEKLLGDGGMGAVYLANDTLLNRPVALKTPKFASQHCASLVERFRREARAAAQLHHRNICPVHDVGHSRGTDYLTMAYIEGKPLSDYISSRTRLDQRQVALIIRRLALALQAAHEAGVVHRDVKPSNVMIDSQGEPILMDFGLASPIESSNDSRLTASGSIVGTPAYMSPEQVRGARAEIGPQSDVYSLGVMFYELLTGRLPFRGSGAEIMGKILIAKPRSLQDLRPDVDDQIAGICEQMMSKSRKARFASMKDVAEVLTDVIRRLRENKTPEPPVVNGGEGQAESPGNTAVELAAIAAEAARYPRRSGGPRTKTHEESRHESSRRSGLMRLHDLSTRKKILLSIGLGLGLSALCLVPVITIGLIGDTPNTTPPNQESTAKVTTVPGEDEKREAAGEIADRSNGPEEPNPDRLTTIYRGFSIDNPHALDGSFLVGSPVTIAFDLANRAEIESVARQMHLPASLGFVRLWIEARDDLVELPSLGLRDNSRYLLNVWDIKASEFSRMRGRQTYQSDIGTEAFSAGAYQCSVEYVSPDDAIIRQAVVDFELRKAPPPVTSPLETSPQNANAPARPKNQEEPLKEPEPVLNPPILNVFERIVLGGEQLAPAIPPPPWRVAPPSTRAISVVNDLEDFSHKLDSVAELMDLEPPGVLPYGIYLANITGGLKRDGTLMWLFGESQRGQLPIAYLLPSTNHRELISGMQRRRTRDMTGVIVEGANFKTIEMEDYSGFALAHPHHVPWLIKCTRNKKNGPGFDRTLGSLSEFLQRQDIGFAMTREFIRDDVSIRLPFAKGDYVIPSSMNRVAKDLFKFTGFQAVAGGTLIKPGRGVDVSLAATIDAESGMESWSETMHLHRDDLVATLPGGQAALVVGVSSCQPWNDWLEQLLGKGCRARFGEEGGRMTELIELESLRGATLMVSANPNVPAREISRQIHLQVHVDDAARAMNGSYAFLSSLAGELKEQSDPGEFNAGLDVAKVKVGGREIVTLEVKLCLLHRDELAFDFSISPLNQNTLVIQGGNADQLESVLARIAENPLPNDPNIASTLDMISVDAQQLILLNAGHASKVAQQFAWVVMPGLGPAAEPSNDASDPAVASKKENAGSGPENSRVPPENARVPPHSFQSAVVAATLESFQNLQPTSLIPQVPFTLLTHDSPGSGEFPLTLRLVGAAIAAGEEARARHARAVEAIAVDPLLLPMKLQPLCNVPPIGVGSHFRSSHVELDVVATEDLLRKVGESDAFQSLQKIVRKAQGFP